MQTKHAVVLAVFTACFANMRSVQAVTITWTGSAGSNSWHAAGNWDLNRVPTTGDDVVIPNMSPDVQVTYSTGNTTINSLNSTEAFTLNGGTLTIQSASTLNGPFTLTGNGSATLTGSGDVFVQSAMSWTAGTMAGTGRTIVSAGGSLNVGDTALKTLRRRLENHSAAAAWNGLSIQFNDGILSNENGGTMVFNVPSNATLTAIGGTNAIVNSGVMHKTGAGTLTFGPNVPLNNNGTFNVDVGGLTISGGGTNTGTIDADAGTVLTFSSNYTHDNSAALLGQGTLTFTTVTTNNIGCTLATDRTINIGGFVNFNAAYTFVGTVNLTAGLGGSGDLTFDGTLNWPSGSMTGTGKTIVSPIGTLMISDGAAGVKTLSRFLENHSPTADWTGFSFQFMGGTFRNAADGVVDMNIGADATILAGGPPNSLENVGLMKKTGSGSIAFGSFNTNLAFINSGTFNIDAGGVTLNGGGANTGIIDVNAGTTLTFGSNFTHDDAAQLLGQGTLTFNTVTTNSIGCTLETDRVFNINGFVNFNADYTFPGTVNLKATLGGTGTITITGTLDWTNNGSMTGSGTTIIAPGGVMTVTNGFLKTLGRRLENRSTNAHWSAGAVQFNNGVLANESGAELTFEFTDTSFFNAVGGGTNAIINAGTMNKTGAGALSIGTAIPVTNNGTLNLESGVLSVTTLTNFAATTLTGGTYNLSGVLRFTNANVVTNAANIVLNGPGSAIHTHSGGNGLAGFAINNADALFQLIGGKNFARSGHFSNLGQLTIGPGDNTFSIDTMQSSGIVTKPGHGTGNLIASSAFTNSGMIEVPEGMLIVPVLSNQSGTTLNGGTYKVGGTLRYGNANIGTNSATLILDGAGSAIQDLSGANALGNLFSNTGTGSLQIMNGRNLAVPGTFENQGHVHIGPGASTLSDTGIYVQTGGTTFLDGGVLDPADMAEFRNGALVGSGVIAGSVRNHGVCRPLDIAIAGDYQQMTQGSLEEVIAGTLGGTEHGMLTVGGTALLAGALDVSLSNFIPAAGDAFDILTAAHVEVKLSTIDLPVLPNLLGWEFADERDVLRVVVVDCGPGDADGDGVGDGCDTTPNLSWHTIDGGGGTSSGGSFKLSGTIGQFDAGSPEAPMSGGEFTLTGGFWPGVENQEAPACSLVGDMNDDGRRDGMDVLLFSGCLTSSGDDCACADVDADGDADTADISVFVQLLLQ